MQKSDWSEKKKDLLIRQKWTLQGKVLWAITNLEIFVTQMRGIENVYVSFSGGADSLVVLDIARRFVNKNILAVFCNTGQEWPEVVRFVKTIPNVQIIRPRKNLQQIYALTGFPLIGKEQSHNIRQAQTLNHNTATYKKVTGNGKFSIPQKYRYLINKPYSISEKCCYYLKKAPFHRYEKETGRRPILGMLANESRLRETTYLRRQGCNSFVRTKESSWPLAIWTAEDVWEYIRHNNIPYCKIYDELEERRTGCVACGYGVTTCPVKLFPLYRKYPNLYKQILRLKNKNITYREALRDSGMILPDE